MIKYVDELKKEELDGKKVMLRVDFDASIVSGKIVDDFRVKAQKENLDYLVNNDAKVLLVGHLGHDTSNASFSPVVEQLGEILGQTLTLIPHSELAQTERMFEACHVLLLDNIRQDQREIKNDDALARELANGFDYYVNNAFAVMHREHASVATITKYLKPYAGLLVKKEIEKLGEAVNEPAEGKILVLGGAKIATKLPTIKNFINKSEKILIGGALANNFFKTMGIDIGDSLVDDSAVIDFKSDNIILPEDVIISRSPDGDEEARPFPIKDIGPGHYVPDIGPETAKHYAEIIGRAKTVIWNGPMGLSEINAFAKGTLIVAKAVAEAKRSIIGGGDTIAAVNKLGLLDRYSFVSTGGGAMLEFLAGNKLPGLKALGYYN